MSEISKGVVYNICQSLLREWGHESLGVLPEEIIQQLLTGVFSIPFNLSIHFHPSYHLIHFSLSETKSCFNTYF